MANGEILPGKLRSVEHASSEVESSLVRTNRGSVLMWLSPTAQIPAQLVTFREEKKRTQAFMNHASDSAARAGMFGHGVYVTA